MSLDGVEVVKAIKVVGDCIGVLEAPALAKIIIIDYNRGRAERLDLGIECIGLKKG